MANAVAILMIKKSNPIQMTCAEGTGIPKGTVLQLSDPFTVAASSGADNEFGGIAAEEKIGGDGKNTISVYRDGYFKVEAGTSGCTAGLPQVMDDGANEFTNAANGDAELGLIFGTALETAAGEDTLQVYVNIGTGGRTV